MPSKKKPEPAVVTTYRATACTVLRIKTVAVGGGIQETSEAIATATSYQEALKIALAMTSVEPLHAALHAAKAHLDWCGYGDKWERECARHQKLPELIDSTLAATDSGLDAVMKATA